MQPPHPPDTGHRSALDQYQRRAWAYDLELAPFEPIRRRAIECLALARGDLVIDAGCGTGLSLPLLHSAVGAEGRIIGIEQCPEMIERARERVREHGWSNVTLLETAVEDAHIGLVADAALLHFTHDVLRQPAALANLRRHLRPGASIVAAGLKWAGPWQWPLNSFVLTAALHSVTSLEGLGRPWSHLEAGTERQRVESMWAGAVFVFSARVSAPGVA